MSVHNKATIRAIEKIAKVKLTRIQREAISNEIIELLQKKVKEIVKAGYANK